MRLKWRCHDPEGDQLSYDVYLDVANPPQELLASSTADTVLARTGLENAKTYYWKVVVSDRPGVTVQSDIWQFSTAASSDDAWDVSRAALVTAHSELDDPPGGYDARDAFGGEYSLYAPERGNVVFQDGFGAGHEDYIEWELPEAVRIGIFDLDYWDDSPGRNWRNLAHFRLKCQAADSTTWRLLYDSDTPQHVGRKRMTAWIDAPLARRFRAEFVRGYGEELDGPRIVELNGWVSP